MIRSAVVVDRNAWRPCRRLWVGLLAPLLLAACGPAGDPELRFASLAPPPPAVIASAPARFTDSAFIADDGVQLPLRKWLPGAPPKAVVLALHGFGDYSHGFAMPAAIWAERGIATYAFDQRGFGGAPGRGLWAGGARLAADAITACRILRLAYPDRPLYLLGESMGGAVAILAATGATASPPADVDGVILSAPAIWARSTMSLGERIALFAAVRLFPDAVLTGSSLHIMASDNLPMLRALATDPLVLKGARVDTIYGLADLMDNGFAAAPRLTAPTLLLYGAHDEVVPRLPIEEFVARLPAEPGQPRRLAYYPQGYHLLLRDLDGSAVAGDVASWILDRGAPLPSRADEAETATPWPPAQGGSG